MSIASLYLKHFPGPVNATYGFLPTFGGIYSKWLCSRGGYSTYFAKSKSVHMLKGLALPRACHSGEIALAGSRRLHSTLAAAPVLFAHAVVTEIKNK
jgi:hypothetical protein